MLASLHALEEVPICRRVDMSGVAAQGLVGRTVRVYWEEDIAWYLGSVVSFDVETHKHKVFTRPCYLWHPILDPADIPSGVS